MRIVDSQIHLFGPNAEAYAARIKQRIMLPEQVIAAMDEAGVERAYLVPAGGTSGNDNCVEAAKRWPDRFRVMGVIGLDKPESRDLLANWKAQSPYAGVRLAFAPFRKTSWITDGTSDWFWPEANRLRLPIMIWAPQQLNDVVGLVTRFPDIKFVIDHLNFFVEDKGEILGKTITELLPLAKYANVAVKASSLPSHSSESYPFRDLHPLIEAVVGAFGADRVMWGTDLTRLPCSYRQSIEMFTQELKFLSSSDLEQIMSGAATRWLGW